MLVNFDTFINNRPIKNEFLRNRFSPKVKFIHRKLSGIHNHSTRTIQQIGMNTKKNLKFRKSLEIKHDCQ